MKRLIDKILKELVKMSVPLCLFAGISYTVMFFEKLYNIQRYRSNLVFIPSIVGAVVFFSLAILISVIRKSGNKRIKKEENYDEEDN